MADEPRKGDQFTWPDPSGQRPGVPMVVTSVQTRHGHRYVYAISARQAASARPDRGAKPLGFSLTEWRSMTGHHPPREDTTP